MSEVNSALRARIAKAKSLVGGTYVNADTKGTCIIKNIFSRNGHHGNATVVEVEVETSDAKTAVAKAMKTHDDFNTVYKTDEPGTKGTMALNNIRTLLLAAVGKDDSDVSDADMDELFDAAYGSQFLRGFRLRYDTTDSTKDKEGKGRSFPRFFPVSSVENNEVEVAKRKADLDARKPLPAKK